MTLTEDFFNNLRAVPLGVPFFLCLVLAGAFTVAAGGLAESFSLHFIGHFVKEILIIEQFCRFFGGMQRFPFSEVRRSIIISPS